MKTSVGLSPKAAQRVQRAWNEAAEARKQLMLAQLVARQTETALNDLVATHAETAGVEQYNDFELAQEDGRAVLVLIDGGE